MKPAMLVIDVQKAFFDDDLVKVQSLNNAIMHINYAIELFREKNLPVISIQHMNKRNNLVPGTEGFELPDELNILDSDIHVHKEFRNAFKKTNLLEELQKLNVDSVFITGYKAENCVLSTYRGADDLDLHPVIIRGGIASNSIESVQFIERINELISIYTLENILKNFF